MPKKYEYVVFLTKNLREFESNTHINIVLDHPINSFDLIEIQAREPHNWDVTNYKLLKVTGTFTYSFLVSIQKGSAHQHLWNFRHSFDHKITTQTIDSDYRTIEKEFFQNKTLSQNVTCMEILFHQEIPEE